MIKISQVIIVEGKYDKIKLSSIVDAVIIETDGFGVFGDKEKLRLIKRLAELKGIIILTDSDRAGFKIRDYICGSVPKEQIKNVYIPDIFGKEKRKFEHSKEGKLGVEGLDNKMLINAFQKAGVLINESSAPSNKRQITKADFYEEGLCGNENSNILRQKLIEYLQLPKRLSANRLIEILNVIMTYEQYKTIIKSFFLFSL